MEYFSINPFVSITADLNVVLRFLRKGLVHSEDNLEIFCFIVDVIFFYIFYLVITFVGHVMDFCKPIFSLTTLLKFLMLF